MYNQNNNQPQKPQSFGNVQETYKYRLETFKAGDQFSIIEDMPKSKPIRTETKRMVGEKDGKKYDFDAKTYLIRIISRGYEADIELKPRELSILAILCPKGLDNFKGSTFIYDGLYWAYIGVEYAQNIQTPISNLSHAMRDQRQPDLNPVEPVDQITKHIETMVADMTKLYAVNSPEYKINNKILTAVANSILPDKAIDLIAAAKTQGYIYETEGIYKVS